MPGNAAPLLLIGMSAFVASIPATPFDQATALPVQVYLWQGMIYPLLPTHFELFT
jgi:phosphate transport system permease protein